MEVYIKMFDGYIASIRTLGDLKRHRDLNKGMEIIAFRNSNVGNIKKDEVRGFVDRYKRGQLNFEDCFSFDSMQEMKDDIDYVNCDAKKELSKEEGKDYNLYDTGDGGLLVMGKDGRLEGFEDIVYYKGKYPTKKKLKDLFEEVVQSGAKNFSIVYDCPIRSWDSYQEKFSGCGSGLTGERIEINLIKNVTF